MSNIDQLCSVLSSLGLHPKEIKIYKTLLTTRIATPSLVAKLTNIERSTCYKHLDTLCEFRLISETRLNKQKAYFAEPPSRVIDLLNNKQKNINLQKKIANDAIKKIKLEKPNKIINPEIQYFKGLEGVKKLYLETLKQSGDILIFFGWDFYPDDLRNFIDNYYIPERVRNNIKCDVITNNSIIEDRDKHEKRRRKRINTSFSPNVEINIYGDQVNFVTYQNADYMGLLIKNQEIANSLREIFNVIWNEKTPQS